MALDRSKFYRTREALRVLGPGWNVDKLRRARAKDMFPGSRVHEGRWWYLRDAVDRVAREEKGTKLTPGEIDAHAVRLLVEGKTDAEVIMEMRLPAEHVARLRKTLRAPSSAPTDPRPLRAPKTPTLPALEAPSPLTNSGPDFWTALMQRKRRA
jgi:hypothetical protein